MFALTVQFIFMCRYSRLWSWFLLVLDIKSSSCISQWVAHTGEAYTTLFSADETSCYSMGSDGKVRHAMTWGVVER